MALSTTTLIGAVNRVLELIGERRVTSLSSPIAILASNIIKDQVNELSTFHEWSWTRDRIPATSWLLQTATLSNITKVLGVVTATTPIYGYTDATFVEKTVFNRLYVYGYDSINYPGTIPRWWTIRGYNQVDVNPYPADSTSQSSVLFDVISTLTPPTVSTGLFPIPEQFMPLIYYRAASVMALAHLADEATAAQFMNLFEVFAQRARQTDGVHPGRGLTMNRRGRGGNY